MKTSTIIEKFERLKRNAQFARTNAGERIALLNRMKGWVFENRQAIRDALAADSGKPPEEADLVEAYHVISEIRYVKRHLRGWMRPHRVRPKLILFTSRPKIIYQAKGVVLIIAPWNYPFLLCVGPMISAIAAGNRVILKPSEVAPNTSHLLKRMVGELFTEDEVAVVEGDKHVAKTLLELPFDHIFFTGSTEVGKKVMRAAAHNLSSVTLELGGKSPCIIDETANLEDAVQKIVWGKFINSGQTCIAPDYVLLHQKHIDRFCEAVSQRINSIYGSSFEERKNSPYSSRIIDNRHFDRLVGLLEISVAKGGKICYGGQSDREERYIEPTIVTGLPEKSPLMDEEIFGPILPVIGFSDIDQAIAEINKLPRPLALYHFSRNRKYVKKVQAEVPAGGSCVNDVLTHFIQPTLPFGGTGASGMGSSHGIYGFRSFSLERPVVKHSQVSLVKLVFPPYTKFKKLVIEIVYRYL